MEKIKCNQYNFCSVRPIIRCNGMRPEVCDYSELKEQPEEKYCNAEKFGLIEDLLGERE